MENVSEESIPEVLSNLVSLENLELIMPTSSVSPEGNVAQQSEATQTEGMLTEASVFTDVPSVHLPPQNALIQIIENELNNIASISLTPDEIYLLKLVMKNMPSSFDDVEKCIRDIISDNTINATDIPKFLTLIKDFHIIIQNMNVNNTTTLTGHQLVSISANVIKYLFPLVLKKLDQDNPNIIQTVNSIIDSATTLLLFIPDIKNKKCKLFFCF